MVRTIFTFRVFSMVAFSFGLFTAQLYAQSCDMSVEATADGSETLIKGVTATAVSRSNSRVYRSSFRQGLPYFVNLPEGEYLITAKKVGYKQTIDIAEHACSGEVNETDVAYLTMWKGPSTAKVNQSERPAMRMVVKTIMGDSDVPNHTDPVPTRPMPVGTPKTVSGGVLNGKATSLPKPEYPAAAMAVKAGGAVSVQVLVDENGNVISASAVSGHPLLRAAAESAARGAKFSPTLISGQPVKVVGVITYNFVP